MTWEKYIRYQYPELGDGIFELNPPMDTHLGGDDFDQCIIDWCLRNSKDEV
jgi:hypothetical protein